MPAFIDSELFIRQTFEIDSRKGYELLFKRYYQPLCNHAVRFVYAKDVAEDLVIDVFGQFWQKQLQHTITVSYRAYLFTTVRHAAYGYLRKEFSRETPTEDFSEMMANMTANTPQQEMQFNELYLKIEQVVRSLPPQSQKVFIMSRFEGKKNVTIAEELQISVKTVEGHITKVLSILRQALRHYGLVTELILLSFWMVEQGVNRLFSLV
ncbi:RNA polymerase sigma-70 factor [Spirosoma koreense]